MDRAEAQQRANRIRAFREELAAAEAAIGPVLEGGPRARLGEFHDATLARLTAEWDVDRTAGEQQLSLGMRVASLVGAIALTAAVVLYFYRIWGIVPTAAQLAAVILLPLGGLAMTAAATRRERTRAFAVIAGLLASAAFALMLAVTGGIYSLPSSAMAPAAWGAFTLTLGLGFQLPLLTVAGTVALVIGLAGVPLALSGMHWGPDNGRFERYLLAGALAMAAPAAWPTRLDRASADLVRVAGFLSIAIAIMTCSSSGMLSLLPLEARVIEAGYGLAGFLVGAVLLWLGLRRQWRWTARAAGGFLVLFTYLKAFDWWWERLPNDLFFLVLAAIAVAALLVLQRIRRGARGEGT